MALVVGEREREREKEKQTAEERADGWIDGRTDGWMDGWKHKLIDSSFLIFLVAMKVMTWT